MELKTFTKSQLPILIDSKEFQDFDFLPISVHRAMSQIKNPRAEEADVLLILALERGNLAGYIGILPDYIFPETETIKCGWLSTLYISNNFRGKGIAQKLLQKAADCYDNNIFINEFTPEAERLYLKSESYIYLPELVGKAYHRRFNLKQILPLKNSKWTKYKTVLSFTDHLLNVSLGIFPHFSSGEVYYKKSAIADNEISEFIAKNPDQGIFMRTIEDLKWMTENPWILLGKKNPRYRFSDFDEDFRPVFLKIYNGENLVNILLLSIRNNVARLQFVFGNNENNKQIAAALSAFVQEEKLASLVVYDAAIIAELDKKNWIFKKKRSRKYFIHKDFQTLDAVSKSFKVSAGDGDSVFT